MSQSIHFVRIKCFSEEFTNELDYTRVLDYLKKIWSEEEAEKLTEDVETEALTLSAYDSDSEDSKHEIEKFFETSSKFQLSQDSMFYFVTEELWNVLETKIFEQYQKGIKEEKVFFKIARDSTNLDGVYQKKMLVVEIS